MTARSLAVAVAVAVRVAQLLLAEHEHVDHRDLFAVNRARGDLTESLRILLRALDTETAMSRPSSAVRGTCVDVKVSEHRAPHRGRERPRHQVPCDRRTRLVHRRRAGITVSPVLSDCLAVMRHSVKMRTVDLLARLENLAEDYGDWDAERLAKELGEDLEAAVPARAPERPVEGEGSTTPAMRPPLGRPYPASWPPLPSEWI
ncbi:hypothetical protein ACFXKI_09340 [Streptomyces mirabilis]|uniref:hypothetical protein n=1 Tax=Streptomyces mirabilis TaxID=68239 RepID=UPI00367CEBB3